MLPRRQVGNPSIDCTPDLLDGRSVSTLQSAIALVDALLDAGLLSDKRVELREVLGSQG